MERKNWLWKKKSSDKVAAAPPDMSDLSASKDDNNVAVPEAEVLPEDMVKLLSEKLAAALSNIQEKEDVITQHIKVAEEAVSGWEKSELEAASLKKQLDEASRSRASLEDRVSHLDCALKECVRQLRLTREEQEQKIQEAVCKRTRESEDELSGLEQRLADVTSQLELSGVHANAISRSLQERARTIAELTAAKADAEEKCHAARARLDAVEKEFLGLKYSFQVLQTEFSLRSEENEYNKRMVATADKQQIENVKNTARLEAECQRLRMLARKKTGMEAGLSKKLMRQTSLLERASDESEARENELLDRLQSMEEETTLLKEILAKKDNELQEARLMCAKTASRLSNVEEQLKSVPSSHHSKQESSPTSVHECGKLFDLELMDDFVEMERLASSGEEKRGDLNADAKARLRSSVCRIIHFVESLAHESRESEVEAAVRKLVTASKLLLQGNAHVLDFVCELSCVLDFLSLSSDSVSGRTNSRTSTCEDDGGHRFLDAEETIRQLQADIVELEKQLRDACQALDEARLRANEADERVLELQSELDSTNRDADEEQAALRGQLQAAKDEAERLRRQSLAAPKAESKRGQYYSSQRIAPSAEETAKLQKEQELAAAAEKLAECQRTILCLGKQIESLANDDNPDSRPEPVSLQEHSYIQKQETYWSSAAVDEAFKVQTPARCDDRKLKPTAAETSASERHGVLGKLFSRTKAGL